MLLSGARTVDGLGGTNIGIQISGHVGNVFAETRKLDTPNLDDPIRFKNSALRAVRHVEDLLPTNVRVNGRAAPSQA